jgi:hypothetical protein
VTEFPLSPAMPNQREVMRRLYREHRGNEEQVVRAYAEAERHGDAPRVSNKHGSDALTYAGALFADGGRKGWLR